jgi:hypothetical protein
VPVASARSSSRRLIEAPGRLSQGSRAFFRLVVVSGNSLVQFFEDVTARAKHSAGRPGPQPFGRGGSPSRRPGVKGSHAVAWSGCGGVTPTPIARAAQPERRVEAYYLQRTRFEGIAERKLRRRQLTEDGNVEISARDLR